MKAAPKPANEADRLEDLYRYQILDSDFEKVYQEIAELAASICGTPSALISFIDTDRQWFKAKVGIDIEESPRDSAFCSHAILEKGVFEVSDALKDVRFHDNPLVTANPKIRFYAGCPIMSTEGMPLGTLCAVDNRPGTLSPEQAKNLQVLAHQVSNQLELRLANLRLCEQAEQIRVHAQHKNRFFKVIAHDLRAPFQGLLGITETLDNSLESFSDDQIHAYLGLLRESTGATYGLLENLLKWSMIETDSIPFNRELLPVLDECRRATSVLQTMVQSKSIELHLEIDPELCVRADSEMFDSIIRNLTSNAVKFTPEGGSISLKADREHAGVRFSLQDSGVGMTEATRRKLFSEDPVSSYGTAGEKGTGLGFQLVRKFVEIHEGRLEIRSTPGCGTIVSISFP